MDERTQIAEFLRDRRARLTPAEVGLAGGGRRRTPGLRREEVAVLAGLSVTHYTRIEQARGARPSAQVLAAVARVLRLSGDERTYLFHLARQVPNGPRPEPVPTPVPATVRRMLAQLDELPALVLDLRMDVLAWNAAAAALFVDFGEVPPDQRNWAWLLFLHPPMRSRFADLDTVAAELVAALRVIDADHGLAPLIGRLGTASATFRRHWGHRDVRQRHSGRHSFDHPVAGAVTLDYELLRTGDHLLLVVYSAEVGSDDHATLTALIAAARRPDPRTP